MATMSKRKWHFRDLAHMPRSQEIPAEANADVIKGLEKFGSKELIDLLDDARVKRKYGTLRIEDKDGHTWAEVELHCGVIVKIWRTLHAVEGSGVVKPSGPYLLAFRQSDMNPLVTMKKPEETNV